MIDTRVKQGKFQVVHVTFRTNGKSDVKEISDWIAIPKDALRHGIPSSRELVAGSKYESLFR